jgi:hypothetical protein
VTAAARRSGVASRRREQTGNTGLHRDQRFGVVEPRNHEHNAWATATLHGVHGTGAVVTHLVDDDHGDFCTVDVSAIYNEDLGSPA